MSRFREAAEECAMSRADGEFPDLQTPPDPAAKLALSARIEPFDSFWEGPEDVEAGYDSFYRYYRANYLPQVPADREAKILVVSCGPGYLNHTLVRHGYRNVVGIDSFPDKVAHGLARGLDCRVERAFPFLADRKECFDAILCEQELNHLTKEEILVFLRLCHESLVPGGKLVVFALNGANPITGAEALAQNFDHFNTFTEYTLKQVLVHSGFERVQLIPLHLYVYYANPANYVAWAAAAALHFCFRMLFRLYGKSASIFTKKLAAACVKPL
jgi:2-polyprenyl-3-methyl-5-hydroxy-6-metoxy-1,4-benzoquinol methylase